MKRFAMASSAGSTQGSGKCRNLFALVPLCVLGLVAFVGSSAPSASAQACANETFRNGPSAHLPNCRAYELVSPPEKEGYEVDDTLKNQAGPAPTASPNGSTILWSTERGAFGEVPSNGPASDYLSRRGSSWNSESVMPPISPYAFLSAAFISAFTEDLSNQVTYVFRKPALTPEASEDSSNLYLRNNDTGSYRWLSVGQPADLGGVEGFESDAISANGRHVIFESEHELTGCGGPSNEQLCDWSAATGALSLVGVLPGGGASEGAVSLAGPDYLRPLSTDGSRVYFQEGGGGECGVCVRVNGATTQLVSETGSFEIANSDGSLAYVTEGEDLKLYNSITDELSPSIAGEVQGVLGASSDGSRVYLVSKEVLALGATGGENNLYLWTQGVGFQFIATGNTSGAFTDNWDANQTGRTSRVTPDGMHVAFTANNSLTGFPDNGKSQAYLYSAATDTLVCGSCVVAEPADGATIVGGTGGLPVGHLTRNLSDDGDRLFFTTEEALVPQDSNGVNDIYQYDAANGTVALISTGTDARAAYFGDASAAGADVLFITRERLVPLDTDTSLDVYDARVGGGLASQYPPPPAPPCTGKVCRGESSSLDFGAPASVAAVGRGNVSSPQNCQKLGREAKKLSNRAKRLRRNARTAKRNGKSALASKRNRKANRLAKQAKQKSNGAKRCRRANRRASK